MCVCAGVCARLWECEVPPGARYLFWPLAPLDSSEWTGRNFYPTQDLDAPHPTQCTVRVCAVCVCAFINNCASVCVQCVVSRCVSCDVSLRPSAGRRNPPQETENGQPSEFVRAAHPQGLPSRGHTLAEFTQTGRTFAQVECVNSCCLLLLSTLFDYFFPVVESQQQQQQPAPPPPSPEKVAIYWQDFLRLF